MKPERKRTSKKKEIPAAKSKKSSAPNSTAARGKAAGSSAAARAAKPVRASDGRKSLRVPKVLLERDPALPRSPSGPGGKFALGPRPPQPPRSHEALKELPESYGTEKLWLVARDPRWVYASWDLTPEQGERYRSLSVDGRLVLRVFAEHLHGRPQVEIELQPEARNWFAHVGRAGTLYAAQLGYRHKDGKWRTISTSAPTITPPDSLSEDSSIQFATIPQSITLEKLVELVQEAAAVSLPLATAIEHLRAAGHQELPPQPAPPPREWAPEQVRALAALVSLDRLRRAWMGSFEITELLRRHIRAQEEAFSIAAGQFSVPPAGAEAALGISSPGAVPPAARAFWFNVNAELVLYGGTEPDAKVTIGGRSIRLRPDGTFSFRFALPDGAYELPVTARSSDQTQERGAVLRFQRQTEWAGEAGVHPQEPSLKKPAPENVS